MDEKLLSIQDVQNVLAEHRQAFDKLWPEDDKFGPRRVLMVELFDAIRLRFHQRAEKNATKHESAFERAAKKITGSNRKLPTQEPTPEVAVISSKTAMELAHEAARSRIRKSD